MYIFEDKNNAYLNQEVDLRINELTSQGLIKSETEYKRVIENTLNNIASDMRRITDIKKYVVKRDDVVSSQQLNSLFVDLESDIRILHKEMNDIHRVINLTFDRNKLFYRRIKNRIASMWKEIQRFRENSFNVEGVTYTFFESFNEDSVMNLVGLDIDKKTGTLLLAPGFINSFSDSSEVAGVDMTLFPAANKDGGLYETTAPQNTFEYNYKSGDRTLLKDGLWKVQMLSADIPELILDIFGRGVNLTYKGLVAYVDITFVSQKLINEVNIDPYGDFKTSVLGMRYITDDVSSDWINVVDDDGDLVTGADVDWISIKNFKPFTAKKLRVIFYQPNFQIINRLLNKVDVMVDKMVKALIEQRFEKINYSYKQPNQFPKFDTSEEADLYDEIMDIIETGGEITTLETKIKDLLIPRPIDIQHDIGSWKLFNLGAWSLDPRTVGYNNQSVGVYISHDPRDKKSGFKMTNGSPSYAKLYTKQQEPNATSIEWYLLADVDSINYVEIPIMANNDRWRNESISYNIYNPLKNGVRYSTNYSNLYNMIKLDFPIHQAYQSVIQVLENGKPIVVGDSINFDFYNSTELYIPTANFTNGTVYSIKYIPAVIDTVRCWTLVSNKDVVPGNIDFGTMCVFATSNAANTMINILREYNGTPPASISVGKDYTIVSHLCTRKEYDEWFMRGTMDTFIDSSMFKDTNGKWFITANDIYHYNEGVTKSSWLYDSSAPSPFSENGNDLYTWCSLKSAIPTIKVTRKQY